MQEDDVVGAVRRRFGQKAADTLDQWSRCINVVEEKRRSRHPASQRRSS